MLPPYIPAVLQLRAPIALNPNRVSITFLWRMEDCSIFFRPKFDDLLMILYQLCCLMFFAFNKLGQSSCKYCHGKNDLFIQAMCEHFWLVWGIPPQGFLYKIFRIIETSVSDIEFCVPSLYLLPCLVLCWSHLLLYICQPVILIPCLLCSWMEKVIKPTPFWTFTASI